VVDLGDEGEAARWDPVVVVEALHDVQLPQRPLEVERARREPRHPDARLAPVAGLRKGDATDVDLQVEAEILDPVGTVGVDGTRMSR
jgi:hypothetical protein